MKAEVFNAVCPLEIGDKVAIKMNRESQTAEKPLDALYLPPNAMVMVGGADVRFAIVTDIATLHYLKSGETQFLYELDASGAYKPMKVEMPVRLYEAELKERERTGALFRK